MTRREILPLAGGLWLALSLANGAAAHRLDEYLQATLIGLTPEGVDLDIGLTPGVAVLPAVLAAIDRNSDGRISPDEERAYVDRVVQDVELRLDGKSVPPRLIGSQFPSQQDMADGTGTIRVKLHADGSGRELRFENRHMPEVSVYLVNCLASPKDGLVVGKQERDRTQKWIRFSYSFADAAETRPDPGCLARVAFCLAIIGSLAAGRAVFRRFDTHSRR
jgi:hypothetical protein